MEQCGLEKVLDQLTFGTYSSIARGLTVYFQGRDGDAIPRMAHNFCALRVQYASDAVIVEDLQQF